MKATEVARLYYDTWNGRDADALVAAFTWPLRADTPLATRSGTEYRSTFSNNSTLLKLTSKQSGLKNLPQASALEMGNWTAKHALKERLREDGTKLPRKRA
jgi:hypothetical protein